MRENIIPSENSPNRGPDFGRWLYAGFLTSSLTPLLCRPAYATTIWDKASEIMNDVYTKLLCEAAERYILLGVLVFTAPVAFAMGASQTTSDIFKSWCRMFAAQVFLLLMNAWCLRLFTSMVGTFIANPLSL